MIPNSPIFVIINLILYAIAGVAIGALIGLLASLVTKSGLQGIWKNALLGSFGFLAGFTACVYMPWHENTVTERLDGGVTVTTTTAMYQHPFRVAIVVSVLLPLLHELYRFKQAHNKQK